MRWQGERRSGNVDDRRGQSMGPVLIGGGGLVLIVVVIVALLLGADPGQVLDDLNQAQSGAPQSATPAPESGTPDASSAPAPRADDQQADYAKVVLAQTEDTWGRIFAASGKTYTPPTLVLYDRATTTGCGVGMDAMGPFYCPLDHKLYLDLAFFAALDKRFGAPGDFAQAYVIAHEVGHHIQELMGVAGQVREAQGMADPARARALSVRLELQADCYAGVFASHDQAQGKLDPGDIDEAMAAAAAVGDDTLQKRTRGEVVPDAFTHGTAAQRTGWFKRGYAAGGTGACDTFSPGQAEL
jgi:predicted metalloprotease